MNGGESGGAAKDLSPHPDADSTTQLDESERLIRAAKKTIQSKDGNGFTLNEVLEVSGLGTRAFYRHFASKDELALAVFTQEAEREARRLEGRTKNSATAVEGVMRWIEARLELGFDQRRAANLRPLTEEAVRASRLFPRRLETAFNRTLDPLVVQLKRGVADGVFGVIDPLEDAKAIHYVVSGVVEQRWAGFPLRFRETRERTLKFCLAALEVNPSAIQAVLHPANQSADDAEASDESASPLV
jgi:AcrR family transcriptional regulator